MSWILVIAIFFLSVGILYRSGEQVIKDLGNITEILGISKFTVSFLVMAVAASLPNLLIGLTSAFKGIPELSLGDILGNNILALSVGVAVASWFLYSKGIPVDNKIIKMTTIFTIIATVFPLLLLSDGVLSAGDGVSLIILFLLYMFWLFSKKERYQKIPVEKGIDPHISKDLRIGLVSTGKILTNVFLLTVSAQGIVWSVSRITELTKIPIMFAGVILVGLASSLPEIYFAASSARKGESEMILGSLMGSVIILSSFVLGTIAIIHPVEIKDPELFKISRAFLLVISLLFLMFARTREKISKKEGFMLFLVYIIFVVVIFSMEAMVW